MTGGIINNMTNDTNKPIRILHVLTAMNMAGTETLLMNFYRNIDRSKVQFDFAVTATKKCAYDDEICRLGGRIICYPLYRPNRHFSYIKWWKDFFSKHSEYKIVHGHIGSTAAIYLKIAKDYGRFTIAHSHSTKGSINLREIAYRFYSYPTRFVADQFFGCSQQALVDRYGKKVARSKKAKVINNAIDAEKYIFNVDSRDRIRQELKIDRKQLILGTVGRLTPQKNPFEIINICQELNNRGINYKFLWFGDGELKDQILTEINKRDLAKKIILMGTRADIYNVLQAFDIFIFPSLWEGLGIACVEAQASGLPTLCSDTIPREAKVSNKCIFLPLNDTDKWCNEISKIAIDIKNDTYIRPDTYADIVRAGYDIKGVATWLENFYLNTMERLDNENSMCNS